jgi:hypothetical protein
MVPANNGAKHKTTDGNGSDRGGFCGALQRFPPTMPTILTRRLSNKENIGFGRVSNFWDFYLTFLPRNFILIFLVF